MYPSSSGTCVTSEWGILIGYTLELVPILVKVQVMNAVQKCKVIHFRRIEIDSKRLRKQLILFIAPILTYLIVWTAVDMPEPIESLTLDNSGDKNIVYLDRSCSSASVVWSTIAYVWQFLLLLSSSVLAFQSRGMKEQIKEIKFIGFLAYSHIMFLIFRIVVRRLSLNSSIPGTTCSSIESILLSLDVLIGTVIYFGPKFYDIMTEKSNAVNRNGLAGAHLRSSELSNLSRLRQSRVSVIIKKPSMMESDMLRSSSKSNLSIISDGSSNPKELLPCALDESTNHSNAASNAVKKVTFIDTVHAED